MYKRDCLRILARVASDIVARSSRLQAVHRTPTQHHARVRRHSLSRAMPPRPAPDGLMSDTKPTTSSSAPAAASKRVSPRENFAQLRATYGDALLKFIASVMFGLKGAMLGVIGTSALPYAQNYLKLSAKELQRYGIVAAFPWTVKPIIGMTSDLFPIGGYHKRYYIALTSIIGSAAIIMLAMTDFKPGMGPMYVLGLLAVNAQVATADLLTEGKYTERMRENPSKSSDMVSFVWMCITLGGVFATVVSFFSIRSKNYNSLLWIAVPLSAQAVFTSLAGWLPEEKVGEPDAESATKRAQGKELWLKNFAVFAMSIFMAFMCLLLAVVQFLQLSNSYVDLAVTLGVTFVLSVSMYLCLPRPIANVTFFLFLTSVLSVSFGSAMSYWFTVDEKCLPDGPHFDYLFYSVYTSIIARVCGAIGIYLFQVFFSNANVRFAFWMSAILSSVASIGDYIIVHRWNKQWGISDKAFYLVGDTILEPIVGMMASMPSVVLMSKMCPENMEATMFAILASFSNLGGSLSSALGVFAMDLAGIKTDLKSSEGGSCDFSGLPNLIFYCGILFPLISIPLTFVFVPNINMQDVVNLDTGKRERKTNDGKESEPLLAANK
jgi:folate/biopterin transporter